MAAAATHPAASGLQSAQYVSVQLRSTDYLSLAEVDVYAEITTPAKGTEIPEP